MFCAASVKSRVRHHNGCRVADTQGCLRAGPFTDSYPSGPFTGPSDTILRPLPSFIDLRKERIRIVVQLLISDHSTVAVNPLFLLYISRMPWDCEGGCGTVWDPGSSEASKCVSKSWYSNYSFIYFSSVNWNVFDHDGSRWDTIQKSAIQTIEPRL